MIVDKDTFELNENRLKSLIFIYGNSGTPEKVLIISSQRRVLHFLT
jgi:hypothetical protein